MTQIVHAAMPSALGRALRRLVIPAILALAMILASAAASAQGVERSGKEVVAASCVACHGSGANGAPKIGDNKAWAKRAAQGLTSLTANALKGIRQMPPHGGNPDLTDTEIERAITYMVNQSGGHWIEPVSRTTKAPERTGEQIVKARCAKCHADGRRRRAEDRRSGGMDSARQAGARRRGSIGDQWPRRHARARGTSQSHRFRNAQRGRLHVQRGYGEVSSLARRPRGRSAFERVGPARPVKDRTLPTPARRGAWRARARRRRSRRRAPPHRSGRSARRGCPGRAKRSSRPPADWAASRDRRRP